MQTGKWQCVLTRTVKNKHTLNLSEGFKPHTYIKEQAHTYSLQNTSAALKSLTKTQVPSV